MTQDEIIRMAREAGLNIPDRRNDLWMPQFERFAAIVAAHELRKCKQEISLMEEHCAELILIEREKCAKRAEAYAYMSDNFNVLAAEIRSME